MKTLMTTGLATAIAATAALSSPVLAGDRHQGETVEVRYSDLDLSTEEGQDTLHRRMMRAAEEVCGIDTRTRGPALPTTEAQQCFAETIEGFERVIAARVEADRRG